jgi:Lon protease (S16) C-terminal proteolytic domain
VTTATTLAAFVALCSALLGKPLQQQMVVPGSMSLGGNIVPVENLAESLQVAFDAGAKRLLLPMASASGAGRGISLARTRMPPRGHLHVTIKAFALPTRNRASPAIGAHYVKTRFGH